MHIEEIKEVLVWAMNKYFQFSNNLKTVVPLSYQNKAILSFKWLYCIHYYVVLSYRMHNCGI